MSRPRRRASSANDFQTEKQEHEVTLPGERLVVLALREARRGKRDALLREIDALMREAQGARGFVSIDVLQPFDEPSIFAHLETWETKKAHDAFDASDVHRRFGKKVRELRQPSQHSRTLEADPAL